MKLFTEPLENKQKLKLAWAGAKWFADDYYRYYHRDEITVRTKSGLVKGFRIESHYDYRYLNFIGIPYAKPPVGNLRFKVCTFLKSLSFYCLFILLKIIGFFLQNLIGSTTVRLPAIKWNNKFRIWSSRFHGMASRYHCTFSNGNRELPSSLGLYTWRSAKRIETSNCLDSW